MDQMIICTNCKTENPAGNLFCQSCGTRLASSNVPPVAGYTQPPQYTQPAQYGQPYPPQGAYPPPAGYPPQYGTPQPNYFAPPAITRLGVRVDGYTDVAGGAAEKAIDVEEVFINNLKEHAIPGVAIHKAEFSVGGMTGKRRIFQLVQHANGSTVAVNFNILGKDLVVSWDLFVKRTPNWLFLGIMAAIILLLPIPMAIFRIPGLSTILPSSSFFLFGLYMLGLILLLMVVPFVFQLIGKLLHGSSWHFFVHQPDAFAVDDTLALSAIVHTTLLKSLKDKKVDISLLHAKGDFTA